MFSKGLWRSSFTITGLGLALVIIGVQAFSSQWSWTTQQFLFVWISACLVLAGCIWAYVWLRGGNEGVKARWQMMQQAQGRPRSKSAFTVGLVFWSAIAIGLVIFFNYTQH